MIDILLDNRYKICSSIGKGLFSEVFEGEHITTHQKLAIKLEHKSMNYPQVKYEAALLEQLRGSIGIPLTYWTGKENVYTALVMERLGNNLGELKKACGGRFSLKTTLMIADQLLCIFEGFHDKGVIHRDIKPENFVTGYAKDSANLYTIDFGLGKRFLQNRVVEGEVQEKVHIPFQTGKSLLGQMTYASIHNLSHEELSRRDDLESLLYMLINLVVGELPWSSISSSKKSKKERKEKVLYHKQNFAINEAFWNNRYVTLNYCDDIERVKVPQEFLEILKLIQALKFAERPNYSLYRSIVFRMMRKYEIEHDFIFDWMLLDQNPDYIGTLTTVNGMLKRPKFDFVENERVVDDLVKLYEIDRELVDYKFEEIERQNNWFDEFIRKDIDIQNHIRVKRMMESRSKSRNQSRGSSVVKNLPKTNKDTKGKKDKEKDCKLI